jgi:hypothetical protein
MVPTSSAPECADEVKTDAVSGSETMTFGNDGLASQSSSITTNGEITITPACAQAGYMSDPQTLCSQLAASAGSDPNLSIDCTYTAPDCGCQVHAIEAVMARGSYMISGTQITTDLAAPNSNYAVQTYDYCVDGNTLTLRSMSAMGGQQFAVLTRQ